MQHVRNSAPPAHVWQHKIEKNGGTVTRQLLGADQTRQELSLFKRAGLGATKVVATAASKFMLTVPSMSWTADRSSASSCSGENTRLIEGQAAHRRRLLGIG